MYDVEPFIKPTLVRAREDRGLYTLYQSYARGDVVEQAGQFYLAKIEHFTAGDGGRTFAEEMALGYWELLPDDIDTFLELSDTPATYGAPGQLPRINATATGLDWYTPPTVDVATWLSLPDTPSSYAGNAFSIVHVNAAENSVEFRPPPVAMPALPAANGQWVLETTDAGTTYQWRPAPTGGAGTPAADSITAFHIAADAIGASELGPNSVNTSHIVNRTIQGQDIAFNTLTASEIGPNAVNTSELADGAATTAKVRDGAITAPKLADNAVTSAKVANASLLGADMVAGTVTSRELANNGITSAKIADGAIAEADLSAAVLAKLNAAGGGRGIRAYSWIISGTEDGPLWTPNLTGTFLIGGSYPGTSDGYIRHNTVRAVNLTTNLAIGGGVAYQVGIGNVITLTAGSTLQMETTRGIGLGSGATVFMTLEKFSTF